MHKPSSTLRCLSILSSFLWSTLYFIIKVSSRAKKSNLASFKLRQSTLRKLQNKDVTQKSGILFFCSSAGEYEQILPILVRLQKNRSFLTHFTSYICFFSPSGVSFADKRRETNQYFLFPGDRSTDVQKLLEFTNAKLVIVNRWEFWPNFLLQSKKRCPTFLVNYSDPKKSSNWMARWIKQALLETFHRIYCIDENEKEKLKQRYNLNGEVIADSKYDRVIDRQELSEQPALQLKNQIKPQLKAAKVLIMGSSWPADHDLIIPELAQLKGSLSAIICMHEPKEENLVNLEATLQKHQLAYNRLSQLNPNERGLDVIVVDSVGLLGEIYHCGDLAWVGGACHHKVHNVLEPAAYNLPIAFGTKFESSIEARKMVEYSCADVLSEGESVRNWLMDKSKAKSHTKAFIKKLAGGSDCLVPQLLEEIPRHEPR